MLSIIKDIICKDKLKNLNYELESEDYEKVDHIIITRDDEKHIILKDDEEFHKETKFDERMMRIINDHLKRLED